MASDDEHRRIVVPLSVAADGTAFGFGDDPAWWDETVECDPEAADHWDARVWSRSPFGSRLS